MQTRQFGWDDMNCFMLDVSMWSGRAKMSRDDLKDPDAVPPDALASLGTLKLIDPDRLKIFNAIKRRALRLLESHGVTFLNGFVVSEDKVDYIDTELDKLKGEYTMSVVNLVDDYSEQCEEWLQKNAQWAHILRPRLPSSADIMRKFSFDWTLFKVQPANSSGTHCGTRALENAKDELGDTAVIEVSKMLGECARNLLRDGRETYNSNSFSAVDKAVNKCKELAFINPELGVLSSLIESVKHGVLNGSLSNDVFRVVFAALSSPVSINNVLELSKAGVSVEDMGWALQPSVTPPAQPAPDEPVVCPMVQDVPQVEHGTLDINVETYDLGDISVETGVYNKTEPDIVKATEVQNELDGIDGRPWKVEVQDIIKDLPIPSPLITTVDREPEVDSNAEYIRAIKREFEERGVNPDSVNVSVYDKDSFLVEYRGEKLYIDIDVIRKYPSTTISGTIDSLINMVGRREDAGNVETDKSYVPDNGAGLMNLDGII